MFLGCNLRCKARFSLGIIRLTSAATTTTPQAELFLIQGIAAGSIWVARLAVPHHPLNLHRTNIPAIDWIQQNRNQQGLAVHRHRAGARSGQLR